MDRSRRSRLARRWLVVLGTAAAVLLVALSLFGFGNARDAARLQLEREAAASAQALQGEWERRRESRWAPLDGVRPRFSNTTVAARVAPPDHSSGWDEASPERVYLVAARASAAAGDLGAAREHALEALRARPALSGEALLALVHVHRQCGDLEGLAATYREAARETTFDSVVGAMSGRLLALVSAADALPAEVVSEELDGLAAAAAAGQLALPPPTDRAILTPGGLDFALDPVWTALAELAQETIPDPRWAEILQEDERHTAATAAAVVAAFDEPPGPLWRATALGEDRWLLARRDGDEIRSLDVRGAALDDSLAKALPGGSEFRVQAFATPADDDVLAGPVELAGAAAPLSIVHPDSAALLGPAAQRIAALRIGLIVLAVLLVASTFAGAHALRRSERLDLLRSTFVASVSHDLRTPIASIGLMAENMASGYAKGSEERYVASIQLETARLRRLVDDLLDFGRIERGLPPRLQLADVSLGPWLDGFEERERARCHARQCALTVERIELPESARLDAQALERALSNLVDNALKHASASAIHLRVRGTGPDAHALIFEVEDDGAGLSRSALTRDLFEPFQRTGDSAGTGLGLAIVRAIAEAHGGSATLEARDDAPGTRARLEVSTSQGVAA